MGEEQHKVVVGLVPSRRGGDLDLLPVHEF